MLNSAISFQARIFKNNPTFIFNLKIIYTVKPRQLNVYIYSSFPRLDDSSRAILNNSILSQGKLASNAMTDSASLKQYLRLEDNVNSQIDTYFLRDSTQDEYSPYSEINDKCMFLYIFESKISLYELKEYLPNIYDEFLYWYSGGL